MQYTGWELQGMDIDEEEEDFEADQDGKEEEAEEEGAEEEDPNRFVIFFFSSLKHTLPGLCNICKSCVLKLKVLN